MNPQQSENTRNTMIFLACVVALMAYETLWVQPQAAKRQQAAQAAAAAAQAKAGPTTPNAAPEPVILSRDQALHADARVPIDTPLNRDKVGGVQGSINLTGALIDDLSLKAYGVEAPDLQDVHGHVTPDGPRVELFRPLNADHGYAAEVRWKGLGADVGETPGESAVWRVVSGSVLTPDHPVVLAWDSPGGVKYQRTFQIDDHFMFTVTDTVTNGTGHAVSLAPYAEILRHGQPADVGKAGNAHEGGIGVFPTGVEDTHPGDKLLGYKDWKKDGGKEYPVTGGWYGITDKYWLGAVIPGDQKAPLTAGFQYNRDFDVYSADFMMTARSLAPGASTTDTVRIFAGAKSDGVLEAYSKTLGIPNFKLAIDWGRLFFLTQPLFLLLQFFSGFTHNYGWSILLLTVVVRGAMFPLALQSYASMSKMKKVQPLLEDIKKKFPNDAAKVQQETMALYQREKINPVAGCLPMLLTIPVFFALYKMLFVTIEIRHQPFIWWIHDLSSRDPSTIMTLFGLIPWNPAAVPMLGGIFDTYLHIGVIPLLYGITTFLQMQMQPSSTDPTQQMIMKFFPIVFTAVIGQLPVGLVIYYVWSNTITILQQWFMMRRHGVENPIDATIARLQARLAGPAAKASG
jgi:YidC/Oxa1 family membrane protein insertase